MSMSLGIYEKAMPDFLGFSEKLECAKKSGFDFLEISIDESDARLSRLEWPEPKIGELFRLSRDTGVFIDTMCLSGHRKFPLGSTDSASQARALEIMRRAIGFSARLGIRIIQLAGYDVYYEASTVETRQNFLKNLRESVQMASAAGVVLGFETMETPFMNTIGKAMHYVTLINSPYLQVYPDIGNITNATDDVISDIKSGTGHIVAAHLKETKEGVFRDLKFGRGRVDFTAAVNQLLAQGVRKFNAEFWSDGGNDYLQECKNAHDFLRPLLKGGN